MPRNGSGQYNLPTGINPVVTQTLITSNWANTTMNDIAQALTQSLSRDGQTVPTANLPLGGFRFTGAGDPQGPQDFMTLSYAQSGQQTRLTNVAGINAITANLPGGLTSFAVGQLVQLVPFATNTGPVTISINGSPFVPILSSIGGQLGPTNLRAGQVYLLSYNGSAWNILTSPDITGFVQAAITGWDRPTPGGPYPDMTIVNANTIGIPAGTGRIIAPSTRDITGVTEVSWVAQNHVLTNIANSWETTIGIDANGNVVEFIGNVNSAWARSTILLGTVGHIDGSIQFISNKPLIFGDVAYMAYDLGILFHNTLIKGGKMSGNVGNPIHIDISAGTLWIVGGAADNVSSPNYLNFPAMPNISFWPVTATNVVGAITQNAPVGFYDPGGAGAVVAVPGAGTNSVIHRLWLLAGQIVWTYGQIVYANLDTAVAALSTDNTLFIPPPKLADATLIGYIIARKDTVNLNDFAFARLISAADAGGASGGGGGGGVTEAPLDGRTYGRNNGAWVTAVDAVISGSNVTVDNTNVNKPVVNVPSGNLVAGPGISFAGDPLNRLLRAAGNLIIAAQGDGDLIGAQGATLSGTTTDRLVGAGNVTITGADSFRNKLINGDFEIWQRVTTTVGGPATGTRFLADRWLEAAAGSTFNSSRQGFVPGQVEVPGNPFFFHRTICGSVAGAGNFCLLSQRVVNAYTFSNETAILSFWAKADSAKPISVEFFQDFGAGGSPAVTAIGVQKINITNVWTRYSVPVTFPSVAGKVFGSLNFIGFNIFFDAGTDFNARTNSLGHQSGTFDIAQAQFEPGNVATQFERRNFSIELEMCQRFYEKSYNIDVLPGTPLADAGRVSFLLSGLPSAAYTQGVQVTYKTRKIRAGTVTAFSHITGASGRMVDAAGADVVASIATPGETGVFIFGGMSVAGSNANNSCHWSCDAEI